MSENGSNHDSFFKGFVIGGIVGALAALLLAPKSGKELRSEIIRKGEEAIEGSKRLYEDAKIRAEAIISDAVEKAQALKEEASAQLAIARQKAESILSGVEEKAEELGETIKGGLSETKTEVLKKKSRLSKALGAGVDAARQELTKK